MPEYYLDKAGNYKFNSDKQRIIPGKKISGLRNIFLELLVSEPGVHSFDEIDKLFFEKTHSGTSENALQALVSRLREDLPEEIRSKLSTAWGEGYYWKTDEE